MNADLRVSAFRVKCTMAQPLGLLLKTSTLLILCKSQLAENLKKLRRKDTYTVEEVSSGMISTAMMNE